MSPEYWNLMFNLYCIFFFFFAFMLFTAYQVLSTNRIQNLSHQQNFAIFLEWHAHFSDPLFIWSFAWIKEFLYLFFRENRLQVYSAGAPSLQANSYSKMGKLNIIVQISLGVIFPISYLTNSFAELLMVYRLFQYLFLLVWFLSQLVLLHCELHNRYAQYPICLVW